MQVISEIITPGVINITSSNIWTCVDICPSALCFALLQAVAVKDLPLPADASKLQLAFALWAEGLAGCISSSQQPPKQAKGQAAAGKQPGGKKGKRAAAAVAADGEETATSTGAGGKSKSSKKAKLQESRTT